jgi:glutamate N-acetyltransferase/amino-acid N-acetyltransferase
VSVTAARGFVASGVTCGIKPSGALDLALVRAIEPAVGAGMFTSHRVPSPAVTVTRAHLGEADPQAFVVNSGVANAFTGERGHLDAVAMASETARLLDLPAEQVLVCSTGVVGGLLPLAKIRAGLPGAVAALAADGGPTAAQAIMTTDTRPKEALVERGGFAVGGMAKGSGMIHPALATMLAFVTTDYPLEPGEAAAFLRPAVEHSFNRISVDGECSTNDTVILLANGASGAERDDAAFAAALGEVCQSLARQIIEDAEGVTVLLEIDVRGAANDAEATAIARRIATSPLVKTAAFGHDPNWGRIMVAAGSAPYNGGFAALDGGRASLSLNGIPVFAGGSPVAGDPPMDGPALSIELDVGVGDGSASYLASDLSYDYVRINAEYTT